MKRPRPGVPSRVTRLILACLLCATVHGAASDRDAPPYELSQTVTKEKLRHTPKLKPRSEGTAEERLLEVYQLLAQSRQSQALLHAQRLVQEHPNFHLAQLALGDLLSAQSRPIRQWGDVPERLIGSSAEVLAQLRHEAQKRVRAMHDRPLPGTVPSQFLLLSQKTRHALAVDASRSRLYLLQNTPSGLKLKADYYISLGKAGTSKSAEGDQKTPLGLYHVTSKLSGKQLTDFYGSGALPISYPNALDSQRGKTGRGIWLHGTPSHQFARAPLATDGCLVLANQDIQHLLKTIEIHSTPILIAPELKWVLPQSLDDERKTFEENLQNWSKAKSAGDFDKLLTFYTADFRLSGIGLANSTPVLKTELKRLQTRSVQLKDLSYIRWTDSADTMLVTFGEVPEGQRTGPTKRQFWIREALQWKIFYEAGW